MIEVEPAKEIEFDYPSHRTGKMRKRRLVLEDSPMKWRRGTDIKDRFVFTWWISGIDKEKGSRRSYQLTLMRGIVEVGWVG